MRPCVLFDVDGTLADNTHRQHFVRQKPKDWKSFFLGIPEDKLIAATYRTLVPLYKHGHNILYVTARPLWTKDMTENWLHEKIDLGIFEDGYYRQNNDFRRDDIVKREILGQLRLDGWEPWLVFDDRDQVVKMWRSEGIPCFQVNDGDF